MKNQRSIIPLELGKSLGFKQSYDDETQKK